MRPWSDDIDPATIPDEVLKSERARRNALLRRTYTGGIYWNEHNPNTRRCRCMECMQARHPKAEAEERSATNNVSALSPAAPVTKNRHRTIAQEKPAAPELLPIEVGEHKTRGGLRAVVVGTTNSWYAEGFVETNRA